MNLKISDYPSIHWEKFFNKFSEIENLPIKEWQVVHILSYFCKLYENHYKVKFSFKFNASSPSKSYEVFQVRKLSQMLSSDPIILKDYIDWFFENKIILKKKRITSLAFLTDVNVANEFKFKKLVMDKTQSIDRTTPLPAQLLEIFKNINIDCKTYGELAFIKKCHQLDPSDTEGQIVLNELSKINFNLEMLERVK